MNRLIVGLKALSKEFVTTENGATAIEYALIASSIFLVIITAVVAVGTKLTGLFTSIATGF